MTSKRSTIAATLATVAVALGACSSSTQASSPRAAATRPAISDPRSLLPAASGTPGASSGSPGARPAATSTPRASGDPWAAAPSPSPFPTPWTSEIPVDAQVQPACVQRGGTMTITITTQPRAGVAYHAVYAGTRGGAPPPYGHGYGGNASGYADPVTGQFSSSWVVSPDAPVGPARVDVIVGWDERWGYAGPGFAVAGRSGTC